MYVHSIIAVALMSMTRTTDQFSLRSTGEHVAEIYFVADSKAFQIYEAEEANPAAAVASMEADIEYFLTQVNARFASLGTINFVISKKKLTILQTEDIFPASSIQDSHLVAATTALTSFDSWLKSQGTLGTVKYDLALLWTGYDLFNTSTATAGYAWLGTVCEGEKASSVVEFDGTYSTVVNTAHEIAHNLGASHDGGASGYIMSPTTSPSSDNRWSFSLCSSSDITGNINQLLENCLTSSDPTQPLELPDRGITAKLGDPDALCRRKKGADSFFCRDSSFYGDDVPKGDAMCKFFYCSDGGQYCSSLISSDGLLCGAGKTCLEGNCVADPSANATGVDDNCLYGDQKTVTFNGVTRTCTDFLDANNDNYCDYPSVSRPCCQTCAERRNDANPSCPYGDKSSQCANYQPYQICGNAKNSDICCGTCEGYTGRKRRGRSTHSVVISPPSLLPPGALMEQHNKRSDNKDTLQPTRKRSHEPQSEL